MSPSKLIPVQPEPLRRELSPREEPPGWLGLPAQHPGSEPDLARYWRAICRGRRVVAGLALLGALLGGMAWVFQTPQYDGVTWLEIQGVNEDFLNLGNVSPVSPGGRPGGRADIPTLVTLLKSRRLLRRACDKLASQRRIYPRVPNFRQAWLGLTSTPPTPDTLESVADAVRVRPVETTRLIEIRARSGHPQLSADFANTLASVFVARMAERRGAAHRQTEASLEQQLSSSRAKLEEAEQRLRSYARSTGLSYSGERENPVEENLRRQQEAVQEARLDRVRKQSQYELASSSPADSLPEILDHGPLREYHVRLTDLRRQNAELSSSYTKAHYKVRRVRAQIGELEAAVEQERQSVLGRIRNEYEAARRRERLLEADYRNQARLVAAKAEENIRYELLKRELETSRELHDHLLQKVKQAGVAAAVTLSHVRVVDPAVAAQQPSWPRGWLHLALGGSTGLLAGVVLAAARDRADRTLREPGQVSAFLGLPELGVIPDAGRAAGSHRKRIPPYTVRVGWSPGAAEGARGGVRIRVSRDESWDRRLASVEDLPPAVTEGFRAARTSLLLAKGGAAPQVVLVTSPGTSEGKTTVAVNLAKALAEDGKRVLLVDADLRRPRVHRLSGCGRSPGLAEWLLRNQGNRRQPLGRFVHPTDIPRLTVLPAGRSHTDVAGLLRSQLIAELVAVARSRYHSVLIDAPPVLPLADARIAAQCADGVLLVIRAGKTTRNAAMAAAAHLVHDKAALLGTVLTCWDPQFSDHRYYLSSPDRRGTRLQPGEAS